MLNTTNSRGRRLRNAALGAAAGSLVLAALIAPAANAAIEPEPVAADTSSSSVTVTSADPAPAPVPAEPAPAPAPAATPAATPTPTPSATPSPTATTAAKPTPSASTVGKPAPTTSASPSGSASPSPSGTAKPTPAPGSKACAVAPKAPYTLKAARTTDDPTSFVIAWSPVACATRYNVSVFATGRDEVNVVDGSTNEYTVTGTDPSKVYKIQVSSRNDLGLGAATPVYTLYPATPAGVIGLKAKYDDVQAAAISWKAPVGREPKSYLLAVTRLSDGKTIIEQELEGDATDAKLEGLDARGMYVITLQPVNGAGKGPKARLVIGDERPNPVTSVAAIRDPGDPGMVIVSWVPSDNTLKGRVIGYEVAYGKGRASENVTVKDTDAELRIPVEQSGVIIVRVITENGKSTYSKPVRVLTDGNIGSTTTNPSVDLVEQDGIVTVAASKAVASDYRLVVRIAPTSANGGFTDTQYSQGGANYLSFRKVPQGMYLVTVEGGGNEIARRYLNIGKAGWMFGGDWKTVLGSPSISNEAVEMPNPGETRVLSTRSMPSQDVTIQSDAQLTAGDGYGFWFRTSNLESNKPSGLTFQYDPKWRGQFIIRLWQNGTECGKPIVEVPFPAGLKINGEHRIVMDARGDSLFATLDGVRLVNVPSLKEAIASNTCKYAAPTGTQVGLRKWTSSTVVFKNISIMS